MLTAAIRLTLLPLVLIATSLPTLANGDIRTERVRFAKGANSATVNGAITGYQTVDYVLAAAKGQTANVSMATENGASYFNILAPGQNEVAFFNGSVNDNQYEGILPASGDYTIRVYMMRSAARRNERANYRLEIIVTGKPEVSPSVEGPAPVGVDGAFDATGKLPCAQFKGQPMGQCDFSVTRSGGGSATVVITRPDGRKRTIRFAGGRPTGADLIQADEAMNFDVQREGDLNLIRVGNERYEIPDAVVSGG